MNRPPAESKRVSVAALRSFTADCLKAAGLRADHADQLAELLSNSDLRGVRSHGTRAMVGYCGSLRDGTVNPTPTCACSKIPKLLSSLTATGVWATRR